jgi:hypothetical protein
MDHTSESMTHHHSSKHSDRYHDSYGHSGKKNAEVQDMEAFDQETVGGVATESLLEDNYEHQQTRTENSEGQDPCTLIANPQKIRRNSQDQSVTASHQVVHVGGDGNSLVQHTDNGSFDNIPASASHGMDESDLLDARHPNAELHHVNMSDETGMPAPDCQHAPALVSAASQSIGGFTQKELLLNNDTTHGDHGSNQSTRETNKGSIFATRHDAVGGKEESEAQFHEYQHTYPDNKNITTGDCLEEERTVFGSRTHAAEDSLPKTTSFCWGNQQQTEAYMPELLHGQFNEAAVDSYVQFGGLFHKLLLPITFEIGAKIVYIVSLNSDRQNQKSVIYIHSFYICLNINSSTYMANVDFFLDVSRSSS